ncbi:MAG: hypothetical protein HQ506_05900 [Candidatus Marinimicrobia bacterium]|nr:hypothetical protein [Candidatus Neomarinimicrobiota bacterium]
MNSSPKPNYRLDKNGEFVISNYNAAKPFSSFFPGIAGKMGIPMWVFYVNRGQGICSMGIQDKENPIMEFLPANWAYQLAPTQGFRTFLKFPESSGITFYEPFQDHIQDKNIERTQSMRISPSHLVLEEENKTLGLRFTVEYHSIPDENYAGIIRNLHITNLNNTDVTFEGLDGLPLIIPFGIGNFGLKNIRRLMEAFVEVKNYDKKAPLFKAKVKPSDTPDVEVLERGNFYAAFQNSALGMKQLTPIVDPERIFGAHNDYSYPDFFISTPFDKLLDHQAFENRYPSAMGMFSTKLGAGETYTVSSVIGHAESQDALNALLPAIMTTDYFSSKAQDSMNIIDELTQKNLVVSREPVFDMYVRQNFLDNVLRGGFPYTFEGENSKSVLHLYSRKHGDLERDYNDYRITPSHYSQGNGNFRDINQNRRSDLLFNPDVGSGNLEHFVNLIQLDGFNPLVLKEVRYRVGDDSAALKVLNAHFKSEISKQVLTFLKNPISPGELLEFLRQKDVVFQGNADVFLGDLLAGCIKVNDTDFAEGYWSDHWTYNLDLLENYLSIYPEKLGHILFGYEAFTFHDSAHRVLPRSDKYVIWDGKTMQLDSVSHDEEKAALIASRSEDQHLMRDEFGQGRIVRASLLIKFLSIITNKIASLDPSGIGVEMETDKPNWYDALNGLPGVLGSSLSETIEIKRTAEFILEAFEQTSPNEDILVFEELHDFASMVFAALSNGDSDYEYWDSATSAKEEYRSKTRLGISGKTIPVDSDWIKEFLQACVAKVDKSINKAISDDTGIPGTYFYHKVVDYQIIDSIDDPGTKHPKLNGRGFPCYQANSFKLVRLPLFLEGPVHYLRTLPKQEMAQQVATNIKSSGLYDKKLEMYKVNAELSDQPMEIGRARVFSPGWFENESIWLHMEYKYMLELLRNGLYDTFFQDFKKVFIPFLDPEVYGRSILENSSFLVSSANPNPDLHGTGFVARLSGATAEFIHILMQMAIGSRAFSVGENGELNFSLDPVLPAWLFTEIEQKTNILVDGVMTEISTPSNCFTFMFLSDVLVTYYNPTQKDTFGENAVKPQSWVLTDGAGQSQTFSGTTLGQDFAQSIRSKQIRRIEITLG